jgi:hypothetical protein
MILKYLLLLYLTFSINSQDSDRIAKDGSGCAEDDDREDDCANGISLFVIWKFLLNEFTDISIWKFVILRVDSIYRTVKSHCYVFKKAFANV